MWWNKLVGSNATGRLLRALADLFRQEYRPLQLDRHILGDVRHRRSQRRHEDERDPLQQNEEPEARRQAELAHKVFVDQADLQKYGVEGTRRWDASLVLQDILSTVGSAIPCYK